MAVSVLFAALLPLAPAPTAPFPVITTDAATITQVAPGVEYGRYEMRTADGPLIVNVVAAGIHAKGVRVGTALANDRLVSGGEPLSSLAARAGAVAGVNGDYFDINQTNQPLNILVRDGKLVRMPMHRWAIFFDQSQHAQFAEFSITQSAQIGQSTMTLKTMNDWPPPGGGTVLMTPEYGALHPVAGTTVYQLLPVRGVPPAATYRVTASDNADTAQPPGYYLAIGNGVANPPVLQTGDTVTVRTDASPPLDGVVSAIGGGPLLVNGGRWFADPDGPSSGEFATHMPASGVAVRSDGTLLLFEIDGRQPSSSIGVLQPQLAALMIAFGAVQGMQFDGGGSSTIVARLPGEQHAAVRNTPSDGVERRIADALLLFSDLPAGPPSRIALNPQTVRALPGARVPLDVAILDAAGHTLPCTTPCAPPKVRVVPARAGRIVGGSFIAGAFRQSATIAIDAGTLHLDSPVEIATSPASIEIVPLEPVARAGGRIQFRARAFDARGYAIALPERLPWVAGGGAIDARGMFTAGDRAAHVSLHIGSARAAQSVIVGEHSVAIPFLEEARFATAPANGPGGLQQDAPCPGCLSLNYDFSGSERAAYANTSIALVQRALGIAAEVYGDGNGEILRVAVTNGINERFLYTIAAVNWTGWRHVDFRFPDELPAPITLKSMYVINRVGAMTPVTAAGTVELRDVREILAGSAQSIHQ